MNARATAAVLAICALGAAASAAAERVGVFDLDAPTGGCVPFAAIKAEAHAQFTQLTARQEAFIAGTFVMNPATHPGLPKGDKALIVKRPGDPYWLVVWVDRDERLSCDRYPIPKVMLDLMNALGQGGGGDDL